MNFKRKKSKESRAGCLLCKPYKAMDNSQKALSARKLKHDHIFKEMVKEFIADHNDVLRELANK